MKTCLRCGSQFQPKEDRPNRPAKSCFTVAGSLPACLGGVDVSPVRPDVSAEALHAELVAGSGTILRLSLLRPVAERECPGRNAPEFSSHSPRRGSAEWMRVRIVVLERDGRRCVACGSDQRLHVHHRREWQPDDPLTDAPDNLETLCATCHRRRHPVRHGPDGRFLMRPNVSHACAQLRLATNACPPPPSAQIYWPL